ncbi:MAG: carboxyl transferase domain-containing protein [Phycisphaerales bacterium]|jgi:acetyl-CoA carboxylase carboxyltransferase component|nr:carboxyl transferase domain-containing protein [Phycisphaerales bacterium]
MSNAPSTARPGDALRAIRDEILGQEAKVRQGGGPKAIERQHEKGRLTARERIARLVDPPAKGSGAADPHASEIPHFQELGLWAAHGMYAEHGGAPAAGVVTGIGVIHGRRHMVIANDATVKAGAFFPMTCKKIIRAQHVARMARMPLVYLVDSAGVFLPMQEDVFPDTDDFGRIFYLNSVLSAEGVPQVAAIMGYCVAGGGYLPVLCDTLLMTEGSGLYLAGPALVKAAIGQEVSDEELGGASMHASISGTIDFKEKDDGACLTRLREVLGKYQPKHARDLAEAARWLSGLASDVMWDIEDGDDEEKSRARRTARMATTIEGVRTLVAPWLVAERRFPPPARDPSEIYDVFTDAPGQQYDAKDIIACLVDSRAVPNAEGHESLAPDFDEYKSDYGQSIVCGYARIGGHACGLVANQKKLTQRTMPGGRAGPSKFTNMPGVIYDDSAEKAARFIMDCNQRKIPLIFLHDTTGFMVGRDSEQGGIIRAGAKMVNAMSNCVVPKIVVILGGSYGAGNYAMCGRAFEPFLTLAWPNAKCAVMGANQATGVLTTIEEASRTRKGEEIDAEAHKAIYAAVHAAYTEQADIRHGAARGWLDRIIAPERTREELVSALDAVAQGWDYTRPFKTGVLQT